MYIERVLSEEAMSGGAVGEGRKGVEYAGELAGSRRDGDPAFRSSPSGLASRSRGAARKRDGAGAASEWELWRVLEEEEEDEDEEGEKEEGEEAEEEAGGSSASDSGPCCRICLCSDLTPSTEGTEAEADAAVVALPSGRLSAADLELLADVCGCRGTQRHVHRHCLAEWRRRCVAEGAPWAACGVCRQPFAEPLPAGTLDFEGFAAKLGAHIEALEEANDILLEYSITRVVIRLACLVVILLIRPLLFLDGPGVAANVPKLVDAPGMYRIVHDNTGVGRAAALGPIASHLRKGARVEVLEVVHRPQDHRVRGRLAHPPGWISLASTRDGHRWAEREAEVQVDCHGPYRVLSPVDITQGTSRRSQIVGDISVGEVVEVVEVLHMPEEERVRGRIWRPAPGWISLLETKRGFRWAEGAEARQLAFNASTASLGGAPHPCSEPAGPAEPP